MRQSWLGDYLLCPQRAKYAIAMPQMRRGSDATAIGTGLHAVIEQAMRGDIRDCDHMVENTRAFVNKELDRDIKRTDISSDPVKMMNCVDSMAIAWWEDIRPHVPTGGMTEYSFKAPLHVNASNGMEIWLEGTMDYVQDDGMAIWDWKTSGRTYYVKEKQTQSHQATCYVAAAAQLGLVPDDCDVAFRFGVMVRQEKPKAQIATVVRGPAHTSWLRRQVKSVVDSALSSWAQPDWVMQDQNNLCSSKWCDYWHLCKGAHWEERHLGIADQSVDIVIPTADDTISATGQRPTEQMGEP